MSTNLTLPLPPPGLSPEGCIAMLENELKKHPMYIYQSEIQQECAIVALRLGFYLGHENVPMVRAQIGHLLSLLDRLEASELSNGPVNYTLPSDDLP